ncbi:MAG: hypothetical protein RDU30_08030 [Desulfovibrionaceae bacterium]|nr:hypothetical protein [Desulfovibrionaceae bacterium]
MKITKNRVSIVVLFLFACLSLASTTTKSYYEIDKETGEMKVTSEHNKNELIKEQKKGHFDDTGRWSGGVENTQPTTDKEPTYIVETWDEGILSSRRHGPTYYYDKNKKLLYVENYNEGRLSWSSKPKNAFPATALSGRGEGADAFTRTFLMLENTRPWYVTKVEKFGFTRSELNTFTAELEPLIAAQHPRTENEFIGAFYDALEDLFLRSEYALFNDIFFFFRDVEFIESAKAFEIRLAEMARYRGQGASTYAVLTASYAAFVQKMAQMGVDSAALQRFTDDLDARMIAKGPLDITDPLFFHTVDTRMEEVFKEMDQSEHQAMFTALNAILIDYFCQGEPLLQAAKDAYFKNVPTAVYMLLLFGD